MAADFLLDGDHEPEEEQDEAHQEPTAAKAQDILPGGFHDLPVGVGEDLVFFELFGLQLSPRFLQGQSVIT